MCHVVGVMVEQFGKAVVRFGGFEANLRSGELYKHGLRLRLAGQPFKILAILLDQPGQVVTREQLQKSLWPGDTFVDFEHSLNSAVKKLREALGDSADQPRYIETLPRMGYRFIAPLAIVDEPQAPVAGLAPETTQPPADQADSVAHNRTAKSRSAWAVGLVAVLAIFTAAWWFHVRFGTRRPAPFATLRITRLTNAGTAHKAEISPDGRYVAYTVINGALQSLLIRQTTTLHDIEIVPPSPVGYYGITFSLNSESVYYVTREAEAEPTVLYRIPVMGGSPEKVKEDMASPVTFSPNGMKLAFVRESASESVLIEADLKSDRERRLFSRRLPRVLDYPAWSPDGKMIACTDLDSSGSDARIIGVQVADGGERPLSDRVWGFARELDWTGDGKALVMTARRQEYNINHVWYVPYPSGVARELTEGMDSQRGASVSADSKQIVTVEERTIASIWRLRLEPGAQPEPVVSGTNGTSSARWSPDGRILYEQQLNGHWGIWIVDADGTNQKQLTLTGNNYQPSISGSGRTLAFISDRSGIPAIWTMDIDGTRARMLIKAWPHTVPELSPDGRWIVYTAMGKGRWPTLWRVAVNGGAVTELNDNLWASPAISPDGKWIAGFYGDQRLSTNSYPDGFAVVSIDGGPVTKAIPLPRSISTSAGIRWSPDGRQLSFVEIGRDAATIWNQPLDGGVPRQVTQLHGATFFDFDWSRDGKQLVFRQGSRARDVVLIEDTGAS